MRPKVLSLAFGVACAAHLAACGSGTPANSATVTWVAVADWYFDVGSTRIYMDGALTRFDPNNFYGGGSGLSYSKTAVCNAASTTDKKVLDAIGKKPSYILTGHSNLDHSYDTAAIAKMTGAHIIGSPSTCMEAQGQGVAASQCTSVMGGESIELGDGVHVRPVHWNHSGNASNPDLHLPLELTKPITPDANGCFKPGVLEDFPNGGGGRGLLLVGGDSAHRWSIFFVDTGSDYDFTQDVPDNVDAQGNACGSATCGHHGSPQANLTAAMQAEKLDHVDLWIGSASLPLAQLVFPIIHPKAFIPNHLGSFYIDFFQGLTTPYTDTTLPAYVSAQGGNFQTPKQFMDAWTVDSTNGTVPTPNTAVKKALGF